MLTEISMLRMDFKAKYKDYLMKFNFGKTEFDELMSLYHLKIMNMVTGYISNSTNALYKRLSRKYLQTINDDLLAFFNGMSLNTY